MEQANNFTQLPNRFIDLLLNRELTKNEARVLLFIGRKTFGFHRTTVRLSRREFNEVLGISLRHITEIQERLQEIGMLKIINKGNSRLSSTEWELDISDQEMKLEKLSKIDRRSSDNPQSTGNPKVTRYPKVTGDLKVTQLDTRPRLLHEAVNKSLNKADAAITELLSLKGNKAELKDGVLYIHNVRVNNPAAYLAKVKQTEIPKKSSGFGDYGFKNAKDLTNH